MDQEAGRVKHASNTIMVYHRTSRRAAAAGVSGRELPSCRGLPEKLEGGDARHMGMVSRAKAAAVLASFRRDRDCEESKMATDDWHGDPTVTIVIIALVICFAWLPIVTAISISQRYRGRFRTSFEKRGWIAPTRQEEKRGPRQWQKQPQIQKPQPVYPAPQSYGLERTMSTRSQGSVASWDPVRRWDTTSSAELLSRNASGRSNFSRPIPSRASSIRSISSMHPMHPPAGQSRSRRPSSSNSMNSSPEAFRIEDTYYDTTPLPGPVSTRVPSIGTLYAKSTKSQASTGSSSQAHRGTSLDMPRSPPAREPEDVFWARPASSHNELPAMPTPPPRRASLHAESQSQMRIRVREDESQDCPEQQWPNFSHAM
ncbi:hypothetical protein B0H67DRAFT_235794 [Lasiosphaeris hirsuta]|uniref:Uncharacterized protein n=1 Tax=Lasiosphaeris hirsuta TaxID=260670 RepID=A0AA40AG30_9PEZI|nr:hypothetical protein B0H67DRAFT_235794 [Lasiosphaeris hirsuta]